MKFGKSKEEREKEEEARLKKTFRDTGKKLAALKKKTANVAPPPPVPPPSSPNATQTQGEIKSLEEFPIGKRIGVELTRIKEGMKRVVVSKGTVQIKVGRGSADPRKFLFFVVGKSAYYVNPKKIIKVTTKGRRGKETVTYKLVFDVLYGEALNQDGSIEWDDELEMILADSGMDQYVSIAAYESAFQLTPTLKKVMLILAFLGFIGGLAINGSSHVIPTTEVHWIP